MSMSFLGWGLSALIFLSFFWAYGFDRDGEPSALSPVFLTGFLLSLFVVAVMMIFPLVDLFL